MLGKRVAHCILVNGSGVFGGKQTTFFLLVQKELGHENLGNQNMCNLPSIAILHVKLSL
jgi:hypothetical protein